VALLDTPVDMEVDELFRSEGHDAIELISRGPGAAPLNIEDEPQYTPKPLVISYGGEDVRFKDPNDIIHTPPTKYKRPQYLVTMQRYRRNIKPAKKLRKSAGILPTPSTGKNLVANCFMPDNPLERSTPDERRVLLNNNGTPRVAPQDEQRCKC
jgi:hypothetical protein